MAYSLANPPSSPLGPSYSMHPPLSLVYTSTSSRTGGGMAGASDMNARRPSVADEPVAVHVGGAKGFRTVSRAASQASVGSNGYNPPSSPTQPLPPYNYSFSSPNRLPDRESTAAWKEMGKVVLEEDGKGPRNGWWVEVGSGGYVLRCWTLPFCTPWDLKMHLASLFPSHLECGAPCYKLLLLYPSDSDDESSPLDTSPRVVELDDRIALREYLGGDGGEEREVKAKFRLVFTGFR